jgi:hypothetical protein
VKIVKLIKMFLLNEAYRKFLIHNHLSDALPLQNNLKQRQTLSSQLFNFVFEYSTRNVEGNKDGLFEWGTSTFGLCL